MTLTDLQQNEAVRTYIRAADEALAALGYTEHAFPHMGITAQRCRYILETLGYDARTVELAQMAAWLHDIGNLVNRVDHSMNGAVMAFQLLSQLGMDPGEIAMIVPAIGNHDEGTGKPISPLAAAMILADKSDVRRSRVRNQDENTFDIHDRVNYSVQQTDLTIREDRKVITLSLTVDTHYGSVMEYFEIFMERMRLCRKAAEFLGMEFQLVINGQELI